MQQNKVRRKSACPHMGIFANNHLINLGNGDGRLLRNKASSPVTKSGGKNRNQNGRKKNCSPDYVKANSHTPKSSKMNQKIKVNKLEKHKQQIHYILNMMATRIQKAWRMYIARKNIRMRLKESAITFNLKNWQSCENIPEIIIMKPALKQQQNKNLICNKIEQLKRQKNFSSVKKKRINPNKNVKKIGRVTTISPTKPFQKLASNKKSFKKFNKIDQKNSKYPPNHSSHLKPLKISFSNNSKITSEQTESLRIMTKIHTPFKSQLEICDTIDFKFIKVNQHEEKQSIKHKNSKFHREDWSCFQKFNNNEVKSKNLIEALSTSLAIYKIQRNSREFDSQPFTYQDSPKMKYHLQNSFVQLTQNYENPQYNKSKYISSISSVNSLELKIIEWLEKHKSEVFSVVNLIQLIFQQLLLDFTSQIKTTNLRKRESLRKNLKNFTHDQSIMFAKTSIESINEWLLSFAHYLLQYRKQQLCLKIFFPPDITDPQIFLQYIQKIETEFQSPDTPIILADDTLVEFEYLECKRNKHQEESEQEIDYQHIHNICLLDSLNQAFSQQLNLNKFDCSIFSFFKKNPRQSKIEYYENQDQEILQKVINRVSFSSMMKLGSTQKDENPNYQFQQIDARHFVKDLPFSSLIVQGRIFLEICESIYNHILEQFAIELYVR